LYKVSVSSVTVSQAYLEASFEDCRIQEHCWLVNTENQNYKKLMLPEGI